MKRVFTTPTGRGVLFLAGTLLCTLAFWTVLITGSQWDNLWTAQSYPESYNASRVVRLYEYYAQEVEDVLRNHPAVFDCALIGVEDDRFGEAVAAAIVLNVGCELSDEELIAYCRQNLPSYKKPRYVAFVDDLPHNVTGKIQKSVLRENSDRLFRPVRGL